VLPPRQLRLAAWRAVFTALRHNPVLAARHHHLVGRTENPLTDTQARVAVAASLLRQLHAVIVTRTITRKVSLRAAAATARSRAARGMSACLGVVHAAGSRAPQAAAAVVTAGACEHGQESAPRALKAGRLPGNGSIVTHQRYPGPLPKWRVCRSWLGYA
jgi:hypothetical protein